PRAGFESHFQKMPAQENWRRGFRFNCQLASVRDKPFLGFGVVPLLARNALRIAAKRIDLRYSIQKIEFALARETAKSAIANFITLLVKLTWLEVIAHQG